MEAPILPKFSTIFFYPFVKKNKNLSCWSQDTLEAGVYILTLYILYKKRLYEYKMNLRRIITSRSYNNEGKQKNTQLR